MESIAKRGSRWQKRLHSSNHTSFLDHTIRQSTESRRPLLSLIESNRMAVSEKINNVLSTLANMIKTSAGQHSDKLRAVPGVASLHQYCPQIDRLVEAMAISESELATTVSRAMFAETLFLASKSILADKEITATELQTAAEWLAPLVTSLDSPVDYDRFRPVTSDNVLDLLRAWTTDTGLYGSCSDSSIMCPLMWVSWIAAASASDPKTFDGYLQVSLLVITWITAHDGVTSDEKQLRSEHTEMCAAMKVLLDSHMRGNKAAGIAPPPPKKRDGAKDPDSRVLKEALAELHSLVGVDSVKAEVDKLVNFLMVRQKRTAAGLPEIKQTLHFVFTGNPGTGKTTVARIIAKILHGCDVLNTSTLVETDRASLVAGYVGQTAIKTSEVINKAVDGVLFIDEAYSLASKGGGSDYGAEAIETLLKRMEDYRDRLVVIVAGYPKNMEEFVSTNPGLESRFTRYLHFQDYHVADLCRIFERLCTSQSYTLTPAAKANAAILFNAAYSKRDATFGNARFVRNVYEKTIGNHADRLALSDGDITKEMLSTIEPSDLPCDMAPDFGGPIDVNGSLWRVQCPGCGKCGTTGLPELAETRRCECGVAYICPWWNLEPTSLPGLKSWCDYDRPEDLIGYTDTGA